jgi:hypothetical protein
VLTLRGKLLAARDNALRRLDDDGIDAGLLSIAADACVVLAALDGQDPNVSQRGGDPNAEGRAQRNEGMRCLAQLLDASLSVDQQAQAIISRFNRYRPMASDADGPPERRALYTIAASGVPVPQSRRHVARILTNEV